MSETLELPYFTIDAKELATWLDRQPASAWWNVDGDPLLTSKVDFPCPSDELSAALREIGKGIRIFDPRDGAVAGGQRILIDQLNDLANTDNNSHARTFLLSWEGSDIQWLMAEDRDAAKDAD